MISWSGRVVIARPFWLSGLGRPPRNGAGIAGYGWMGRLSGALGDDIIFMSCIAWSYHIHRCCRQIARSVGIEGIQRAIRGKIAVKAVSIVTVVAYRVGHLFPFKAAAHAPVQTIQMLNSTLQGHAVPFMVAIAIRLCRSICAGAGCRHQIRLIHGVEEILRCDFLAIYAEAWQVFLVIFLVKIINGDGRIVLE